ncbi:RHS repeat-associated core domain-containing protein [Pseudomonas sp. RA_35y_Pfl2_P32]|uniref:RHS repeat-associated core domain-containing protein n=1 Tax=Pseudomonas sp. RA_35y_Pfl2_P32 TaxID=3088705 RepID=UPI0030DCB939
MRVDTHTPGLTVIDSRGLSVRQVAYWRGDSRQISPQARITSAQHDAAGRAVAQRDPRFQAPSQRANLTTVYSLSVTALLTDSVDAGWRLGLSGEAGQPLEHWDGRGSHWRSEFDPQLRPLAVHDRALEGEVKVVERMSYAGSAPEFARRNQCGRLIRHDDPAGSQLFAVFGLSGGVLEQTRFFLRELVTPTWPEPVDERELMLEPGPGATTRSHYNAQGEVIEQTDAKGHRQFFAQTVAGQLDEVRLQLAHDQRPTTLVNTLQYNADGQAEREVAGNGVMTTLEYNAQDGRLTRLQAKRGIEALQDLRYVYDPKGNVSSIEDAALPIRFFANQRIEPISWYWYDSLGQLIEATGWEAGGPNKGPPFSASDDPVPCANYHQRYRYDKGGNLLELVHQGSQKHGHQLVAAAHSNRCLPVREGVEPGEDDFRKGFDGNGNLLNLQPGQLLTWDPRNQLCEVCPVERETGVNDREGYVYGADGMRVRKIRSAQTNARTLISETRYLPNLELRSHTGTGEVLQVINVQAGRSSVRVLHWASAPPTDTANDRYRYSLNDHLGSSTLELDDAGEVISQERYHPFGTTAWFAGRGEVEASYKTVRYSGKERDATGLYYYGFRYYLAGWQRWLNPDPAGEVDGLNFYCIVQNNPVSYKDDDGRQSDFSKFYKPEQGDLIFGLAKVLDQGYLSWRAALTGRGDYLAKYISGDDIARLEKDLDPLRHSYRSIRDSARRLALYSGVAKTGINDRFWQGQYSSFDALIFKKEEKYYENIKARYEGRTSTAANKQFSESYADNLSKGHYSVRKTFEKYVDVDDKFGHKLISRASKAGLSTILNSGRTDVIHFTLDELDMEQVVMKTRASATSSELRYLFRNREKLADKVLFYRKQMLVDAPWRTDQAGWSRYTPKSASSNTLLPKK